MMKVCNKCGKERDSGVFAKDKWKADGLRTICKICQAKYSKKYIEDNKEKIKEYITKYNKENRDKLLENKREYHKNNKEKEREYNKEYRKNNRDKILQKQREYRSIESNRQKESTRAKEYRKNNRDKINKTRKERYHRDRCFQLRIIVSNAINTNLKKRNLSKNNSCINSLPYTLEELKQHLESQFEDWMTWDNYGAYEPDGICKWQIDHIIPHSSFQYETLDCDEFRKCWSLDNLQPIEVIENIKKGNKVDD